MEITEEIISQFRSKMSVFEDSTKWNDDTITDALEEADAETGGRGWGIYQNEPGNFKRRGMFAYASHWLAVTFPTGDAVMSGGQKSAVAAKTVGDESVTYVTGNLTGASTGEVWLASSGFGQQFIRLRNRAGRGARAV